MTRRALGYGFVVAGFAAFMATFVVASFDPVTGPEFTAALPAGLPLPIRLVFYGDSRPRTFVEKGWRDDPGPDLRGRIIEAILAESPAAVIHSGDLVTFGDSAPEWSRFDREMAPFRRRGIPFYPALGNHEYYWLDAIALENYFSRFPLLDRRHWYDLRVGPLQILVLDTNAGALGEAGVALQQSWYEEKLRAATADAAIRCVVVVAHHSPYTNAISHGPDAFTREKVVEAGKSCAKAKLFVTGHVHAYERFEIDGRMFVVSGGGGAPRFSLRTGAEARFKDSFEGPQYRPFHYCVATVEARRLRVDVMMLDDTKLTWSRGDGFTIDY